MPGWVCICWFATHSYGEGNETPLQYSCLENPRDGEPGGLPSMGSHRVGHDEATWQQQQQQHPFLWRKCVCVCVCDRSEICLPYRMTHENKKQIQAFLKFLLL